jgi:3-oxoacyl-[acyl-carrier protein] reductase
VAARRQFHCPIDLQRTGEEASLNPPDLLPPKVADIAAVSFLAGEESGFSSGQVIYVAGGPRA